MCSTWVFALMFISQRDIWKLLFLQLQSLITEKCFHQGGKWLQNKNQIQNSLNAGPVSRKKKIKRIHCLYYVGIVPVHQIFECYKIGLNITLQVTFPSCVSGKAFPMCPHGKILLQFKWWHFRRQRSCTVWNCLTVEEMNMLFITISTSYVQSLRIYSLMRARGMQGT